MPSTNTEQPLTADEIETLRKGAVEAIEQLRAESLDSYAGPHTECTTTARSEQRFLHVKDLWPPVEEMKATNDTMGARRLGSITNHFVLHVRQGQ